MFYKLIVQWFQIVNLVCKSNQYPGYEDEICMRWPCVSTIVQWTISSRRLCRFTWEIRIFMLRGKPCCMTPSKQISARCHSGVISTFVMRCAIWYHLYYLKNVKNTHGGVLISVKLQAEANWWRWSSLIKLRCFWVFSKRTPLYW